MDIFCKILNKEIHSDIIAEGADWIAINDIHPQAPVHVLIIPKKHISSIVDVTEEDRAILGNIILAAQEIAKKLNLEYKGFRLIANQGQDGGQVVEHLHFHLLGGTQLGPKIVH